MKKISWGTGIAVVYIIFFTIVVSTVIFTTTVDINLVTEDYYEEELKHQQQIDKLIRTNELPGKVDINVINDGIRIQFPSIFKSQDINGKIKFYRPSNKDDDFAVEINLSDSLYQIIQTSSLNKGYWKIKMDWSGKDIEYYTEKIIMVN